MDSSLLVLSCLNRGGADFLGIDLGYAHGIISHLLRTSNLSILLTWDCDVKKYEDCLNRDFGCQIGVISVAEMSRHITEPWDTRLIDHRPFVHQSVQIYEFISRLNFDIVFFDVFDAPGFIPIRAKKTGLGLEKTLLVSWLRVCHEYLDRQILEPPDNVDPLMFREQTDFAEKYCCENSDLVVNHTDTIREWAFEQEWNINPGKIVPLDSLQSRSSLRCFEDQLKLDDPKQDQELHQLKMSPLVSICVAHYNDGQNLRYLLQSIEHGDYENFEVIVVDDGSTDTESVQAVKTLATEYNSDSWRFIMKEKNEGPGPTRNFAVSHARAEFIIFMDSDDLAARTFLSDFVKAMSRSGVDCLTCSIIPFRGDGGTVDKSNQILLYMPLGGCVELAFHDNFFGGAGFCVKKSVFEALGGFSDNFGIVEDWDFMARLVLMGFEMDVVPKGIYFVRQRPGSRNASIWSSNTKQTLRKRLLASAGNHYNEFIDNLLLRAIADNERLRGSVGKKLDSIVVKIALRLSGFIQYLRTRLKTERGHA